MHAYKERSFPDLKIRSVGPLGIYIYIYISPQASACADHLLSADAARRNRWDNNNDNNNNNNNKNNKNNNNKGELEDQFVAGVGFWSL